MMNWKRAKIIVLLLPATMLLQSFHARTAEVFSDGPVTCTSTRPDMKVLSFEGCQWNKAPDDSFYEGVCKGVIALGARTVAFTAQGEARRIDYVYPDNDEPLRFDHSGLSCVLSSSRLKTVQNCRASPDGLTKACQVCVVTGAKVCFNVRVEVRLTTVAGAR